MAISEFNTDLPGIQFNTGIDVTADMMTAFQQYIANETIERTADFTKYAGFAWGMHIGAVVGQSVQITAGSSIDQNGVRMEHPQVRTYDVVFPQTGFNVGYLCVKAIPVDVSYRVHPFNGTRKPTENAISLSFFVVQESELYDDEQGHIYPTDNDGLVIARLTIQGPSYTWDESVANKYRSPYITMQDGT